MGPLDAIGHLLNFLAPAFAVAASTAALAKWCWRSALAGVPWLRLAGWSALASSLVLFGGLVAFGHDGRMATYGAMLLANAAALWFVGFALPPRR